MRYTPTLMLGREREREHSKLRLESLIWKELGKVILEALVISFNGWILHYIKRSKRRSRDLFHGKEAIVAMEWTPQIIHTHSLEEELVWAVECTLGSIEGQGKHVLGTIKSTPSSISILWCFAASTIRVAERTCQASSPDLVGPFFRLPAHAHPVSWRLVENEVCPLVLFKFVLDIKKFGHVGGLYLAPLPFEEVFCNLAVGRIQFSL